MASVRVTRPAPEPVITALTRCGISRATAMAMPDWKAREVLELLCDGASPAARALRGGPRLRGTLGTRQG